MTNFTGSKYEATKELKAKDIAALIRAELKEAGIKARVRTRRATWSSAIDIVIEQAPEGGIYRPEYFLGQPGWIAAGALALQKRVEEIANAYNFDRSDLQSDYFHNRFFLDVEFSAELKSADRDRAMAKAMAMKADAEKSSQERFLAWAGAS